MGDDTGVGRTADPPGHRSSTLASRRIYSGRVLNLDLDQVRFPNGTTGQLELIRHSGAAAVLPFLDEPNDLRARVVLIRQFRYAADRFLYEVPAGRLDRDEPPEQCARRELLEETGYAAATIVPLGGFYTTPGFIDEYIHLYLATGLTRGDASPESDEFIHPESQPLESAIRMIERGEIVDGKTIVALFKAEHLIRLRQAHP